MKKYKYDTKHPGSWLLVTAPGQSVFKITENQTPAL